MTALMESPPVAPQPSPLQRWNSLNAFIRYAVYAAIGIFVLAAAEALESGGVGRLTSGPAASAMLRWCLRFRPGTSRAGRWRG